MLWLSTEGFGGLFAAQGQATMELQLAVVNGHGAASGFQVTALFRGSHSVRKYLQKKAVSPI